jgi:hypothetical protein
VPAERDHSGAQLDRQKTGISHKKPVDLTIQNVYIDPAFSQCDTADLKESGRSSINKMFLNKMMES